MKQHVFYHSADLDGKCSGAIARWHLGDGVCLHPINYGEEFPYDHVAGEEVMMFDFSLQPFSKMDKLFNTAKNTLWIDHHKASIEEYHDYGKVPPNATVVLNSELAACELVWLHFKGEIIPKAVAYLGRYDRWDHSDRDVVLFHSGLEQYDLYPDDPMWAKLFNSSPWLITKTIREGKIVERYKIARNKRIMRASFPAQIVANGQVYRCLAVNSAGPGAMLFSSQWDPAKYDAMLSFRYDGKWWTVSLYSDPTGPDVSAIARVFGGGGHHGAAGFQTTKLGLEALLHGQSGNV